MTGDFTISIYDQSSRHNVCNPFLPLLSLTYKDLEKGAACFRQQYFVKCRRYCGGVFV